MPTLRIQIHLVVLFQHQFREATDTFSGLIDLVDIILLLPQRPLFVLLIELCHRAKEPLAIALISEVVALRLILGSTLGNTCFLMRNV